MFDKIYIRDLQLRCVIGINDDERSNLQDIIINIILHVDLKKPCLSDNINDAVDYKVIKKSIINLVEQSSFFLLERLAEVIANECLKNERVEQVEVTIDKPGALRFARSAAVEITRAR